MWGCCCCAIVIYLVFIGLASWSWAVVAIVLIFCMFFAAVLYMCSWFQNRDVKAFAAAKLEASGPEEPLTLSSATEKRLKRSQMNIGEVDNPSAGSGYKYNYNDYVRDAAGCGTRRRSRSNGE